MKLKAKLGLLLVCTVFGGGLMIAFYSISENIIHYHNRFIRRFPQHVAQQEHEADLTFSSYYFAGSSKDKIYLGNYTAPLQIMVLDSKLKSKNIYHIELKEKDLPFQSPQIRVQDNNFYVFEGIMPYIFTGKTNNWIGSLKMNSGRYFSDLQPIDSLNVAIRYMLPGKGESILGTQNLSDTSKTKYNASLLQKQFDGIFDTDGKLLFNQQLNKIIYTYRYRNQFIIANPNLQLSYRGKTIDTVSHAKIKLAGIKKTKMKTFAEPPLVVNKIVASSGKLLYVNSMLPGLYESEHIWKIASIIDVYDVTNGTYRSSFPIYNIGNKKARDILVNGNFFYALIGNKIVSYKLLEHLSQSQSAKSLSKE